VRSLSSYKSNESGLAHGVPRRSGGLLDVGLDQPPEQSLVGSGELLDGELVSVYLEGRHGGHVGFGGDVVQLVDVDLSGSEREARPGPP